MRLQPSLLSGVLAASLAFAPAWAAEPPLAAVTLVGAPQIVFEPKRDACDGNDVADVPARAYRDAAGTVVMFALHTKNRAVRGADLDHLKIDCTPALPSNGREDPAAYDDASWIAATWTANGRDVSALVHHEFQANTHPGRCTRKEYLACWYNSVVGVSSTDGGRRFDRPDPPLVAVAAPFRQDVGQGRHRGFFNPSNIVSDGRYHYMLTATTGWSGQSAGACLFRTADPADPSSWRGWDGKGFTSRFGDPYREKVATPSCVTIAPFPTPIGSVSRHRGTGAWIAVFQASPIGPDFPQPGFYTTSSTDLITWDKPRLLVAGPTLYEDSCKSDGRQIAYPSLIDPAAEGRNFDNVGDRAELFYADLTVNGCQVVDRHLMRRSVAIKVLR